MKSKVHVLKGWWHHMARLAVRWMPVLYTDLKGIMYSTVRLHIGKLILRLMIHNIMLWSNRTQAYLAPRHGIHLRLYDMHNGLPRTDGLLVGRQGKLHGSRLEAALKGVHQATEPLA